MKRLIIWWILINIVKLGAYILADTISLTFFCCRTESFFNNCSGIRSAGNRHNLRLLSYQGWSQGSAHCTWTRAMQPRFDWFLKNSYGLKHHDVKQRDDSLNYIARQNNPFANNISGQHHTCIDPIWLTRMNPIIDEHYHFVPNMPGNRVKLFIITYRDKIKRISCISSIPCLELQLMWFIRKCLIKLNSLKISRCFFSITLIKSSFLGITKNWDSD